MRTLATGLPPPGAKGVAATSDAVKGRKLFVKQKQVAVYVYSQQPALDGAAEDCSANGTG